jgi:hypothetical protein
LYYLAVTLGPSSKRLLKIIIATAFVVDYLKHEFHMTASARSRGIGLHGRALIAADA